MSLHDNAMWVITTILFVLILVPMKYGYDESFNEMSVVFGVDSNATAFMEAVEESWAFLDYVVIASYTSFLVVSVVTAYFVRTHPVFFIFYTVGLMFLVFTTYIYQNTLIEVTETLPEFLAIYQAFPSTNWFIENITLITLMTSSLIAVIQYSKIDVFDPLIRKF